MACIWGYSWPDQYFYHSWLLWLFLILAITATVVFLVNRLRQTQRLQCPHCTSPVQEAYLRCPNCGQGLKSHCPRCSRIVETSWQFCPHCKGELRSSGGPEESAAGKSSVCNKKTTGC